MSFGLGIVAGGAVFREDIGAVLIVLQRSALFRVLLVYRTLYVEVLGV